MNDETETESESVHTQDTEPPGSDPGALEELGNLLDAASELFEEIRGPNNARPKQLFVRWREVPGGIEVTSCTLRALEEPCKGGEHEGRFR